jgi:hypothetical protein
MLTRKRQRDTEIQNRFNESTLEQSNQFHPILESITIFLRFKDCGSVARLNKDYHLKAWIYLLKSKNRSIREPININFKSVKWLEKYKKSLKNQHLSLFIAEYPWSNNRERERAFLKIRNQEDVQRFLNNNQQIHSFTFSHRYHDTHVLYNIATYLKELTWLGRNIDSFPCFPVLEFLDISHTTVSGNLFAFLAKQCPALKELIIFDCFASDIIIKLGSTVKKLKIKHHSHLKNLEPFRCLQLQELDISNCMYITDFSPVAHIPIVKKFKFEYHPWQSY